MNIYAAIILNFAILLASCIIANMHHWGVLIGVLIAFPSILISNLMPKGTRLITFFAANRNFLAFLVLCASGVVGYTLFIRSEAFHDLLPLMVESPISFIKYLIAGVLIGSVIRMLIDTIGFFSLFGLPTESRKTVLLAGYCAGLILFPSSGKPDAVSLNKAFAGIYIFGIGLGFFFHFYMRTSKRLTAERKRMCDRILTLLGKHQSELDSIDSKALEYYIKRKFSSISKLVQKTGLSANLAIIEACMERAKGKHDESINTIKEGLEIPHKPANIEAAMMLCQALALSEMGGKDREMKEILEKTLEVYPNCTLTRATIAVRSAEELSMNESAPHEEREKPLKEILSALELNRKKDTSLIDQALGHSVPFTSTFLIDVYAYTLLVAGDYQLSKYMLIQCIRDDPAYSSAYLHLGEWYLTRYEKLLHLEKHDQANRLLKPAEYCLWMGKQLESGKSSRIKRRAEEYIRKYFGDKQRDPVD